jgi:hypothetical protein
MNFWCLQQQFSAGLLSHFLVIKRHIFAAKEAPKRRNNHWGTQCASIGAAKKPNVLFALPGCGTKLIK